MCIKFSRKKKILYYSLPKLEYKTHERLNCFEMNENDILSIIKNLNASKAHEWDKISIRMIKLCGKTIASPFH